MKKTLVGFILAGALTCVPMLAQSTATVRAAQQALKDKGFDPGAVDGVNGPATRSAVKKYQAQQNLDADGRLGSKTLDALGVKEARPAKQFAASGDNVKNSYSKGGSDVAKGSKEMAGDMKTGHVGDGAVDFGRGIGKGVKKMAVGTGHAAKNVGKGVANAVTPDKPENKPE